MKRAVFLDRDGTIIEDRNFISRTDDVVFLPGAASALRALQRAGFLQFIVTNQSGVGRGLFSLEDMEKVSRYFCEQLEKRGVTLDGVFACPHHPDEGCACRKPSPDNLLAAAKQHDLDLAQSFFIGDRLSDIQTGQNAGCTPILVETGLGKETLQKERDKLRDVIVVKDLAAAAKIILKSRLKARAA